MKLYGSRLCPFVDRIKLILAFKKVKYENINVNLNLKTKEFLNLTPFGKVPVLLTDDGKPIYESAAIYQYVNDVYPKPIDLMSKDPYMRAMQRTWVYFANTRLSKSLYEYLFNQDPEKEEALKNQLNKNLKLLEFEGLNTLQGLNGNHSAFFLGEDNNQLPSMPDMMYLPFLVRLEVLKHFKGFDHNFVRIKELAKVNMEQSYYKDNKELPTLDEIIKGYTPYVKGEMKMKEDWIL
ncbi:hypothetical protein ABK040_011822 [Willaertia magna]